MPNIEIKNLTKKFGDFEAVSEMSLSIPDGVFCVFLGPSGCGKSTTLNIIAGLEEASSGSIFIGSRDVTNLAPHSRNIAMVFQSSLLYPHLTALQNIKMSLKNSTIDNVESKKRIDHAVAILSIDDVLNKKPSAMSGGQRQRVAMAKAIVRQPDAFLMDEPLAALDASLRQSLRSDLVALQKRLGTTTIFVTHDQIEAMTMGDMIVVMNDGQVEQIGTPDEIYSNPASKFVASFIGSPPMNFFKGTLIKDDNTKTPALNLADQINIEIPPHLLNKINEQIEDYVLCIRPQHITLSKTKVDNAVKATIEVIENLGKEAVIILKDTQDNTYRVLERARHSYKNGEDVYLSLRLDRTHLFTG